MIDITTLYFHVKCQSVSLNLIVHFKNNTRQTLRCHCDGELDSCLLFHFYVHKKLLFQTPQACLFLNCHKRTFVVALYYFQMSTQYTNVF